MFKWKEEYKCNVGEIDKQHKRLFELGEEIYDIVSLNDGYDHYDDIINALRDMQDYAIYHFEYEEELMDKYGYSDLEAQKIQHKAFVDKIISIEKQDIDSNQRKVCMDLLIFVADWIEKHILKSDMGYKDYLNSKGVF